MHMVNTVKHVLLLLCQAAGVSRARTDDQVAIMRAGNQGSEEQPDLHYNLLPRKVQDFQPYNMVDFVGQNYNAKHANYWRLGGLGPEETEELKVLASQSASLLALAHYHRAQHPTPAGQLMVCKLAEKSTAAGQAAEGCGAQEHGQAHSRQEHERGAWAAQAC